MRRRMAAVLGLALLGLVATRMWAETPMAPEARLRKDLQFLTSDECEGRGITTKGINLAAEYIAREFQSIGLKPGGPDGTYFQTFKLLTGGKLGPNNRLTLQGPQGQTVALEQGKHYSVSLLSPVAKVEGPLVFAGYGLHLPAQKYDDFAGLDVAGKVVVVLSGHPRAGSRFADDFATALANDPENVKLSTRDKINNARSRKAAAVVLVNTQATASRFRDTLPAPRVSLRDGDVYEAPLTYLKRDWLDWMMSSTGTSLEQIEKETEADLKPRGRALTGWTCKLETDLTHNRITVKNILGVVEGSGPLSKETVVVGAHYDHVGMGSGGGGLGFGGTTGSASPGGVGLPTTELGRSAIHHGADDNASGTVTVMELARRFVPQKDRPGRRIVFMAFTAEESGLIGSAYYCRNPVFPLADTAAMLNMDMVGRLQDGKLEVSGVGTSKGFPELVDKLNDKHKLNLVKSMTGGGASDHASFYNAKVPVLNLFTGFHEQYHRPTDVYETINVAGIQKIADLAGDMLTELRTMPERPAFQKSNERFVRNKLLWSNSPATGITPDYRDKGKGVLVADVVANTAATKSGVKKGDRLLSADGTAIKDASAFHEMSRAWPLGKKVELTVERGGKEEKVALQLPTERRGFGDSRFGFSPGPADDGILVEDVTENGPATKAGLKKGDKIVAIGGETVNSLRTYTEAVRNVTTGTKMEFTVLRDGKKQTMQIEAQAAPRRGGRLGFSIDPGAAGEGVTIQSVTDGSAAATAGLKAGDRITQIDDKPIKTVQDLIQIVGRPDVTGTFEFTVVRDGKPTKVKVELK